MFRKFRLFATGFLTTGFLAVALGTSAIAAGHGAESSINPQPLPPRVLQQPSGTAVMGGGIGPGSRVMINPQPLPPKQQYGATGIR